MATNNILPFCGTDTGTNLLTQSEYNLSTDRTSGNKPGVASSKLVNKAIRQSAFIASQLAQYLSDITGDNVLDDNNTANLYATIVSALGQPSSSTNLQNLGIAASVAASALTIRMKQKDGTTDPATGTGSVVIGFRNATSATGGYVRRSVTAALSMVVSSGSTLGTTNAVLSNVYVYAIDNAGTVELAVSRTFYDDGSIVTTTAEGGAGAADSATAIYSTTARTGVALRLIGRITSTQATAGTWATAPTELALMPFPRPGTVLGAAFAELTTGGAASTTIPSDDTIPQSGEGNEILTCSYTPRSAASQLVVEIQTYLNEQSNTGDYCTAAIFRDSGADAIGGGFTPGQNSNNLNGGPVSAACAVMAGSTALTTFKLNVGNNSGSIAWNRNNSGSARLFGGAVKTYIRVTEIAQ